MTPKTGMYIGLGASAGLVILIVAGALVVRSGRDSVGSPTQATRAGGMLSKIELDLDVGKLVSLPPASGTGAEEAYQAAVKGAVAMGEDFAAILKDIPEPEKNPACKLILDKLEEAADKGLATADLNFDATLPLTPGGEWRVRDMLVAMGTVAAKSGMSMRSEKNREGSEKALRAALIWGHRLFKNGVFVAYKSAGMACISESLAQYDRHYSKDFYADAGKAAVAKELYGVYLPASQKWAAKEMIVRNTKAAPGDLWNLAENDKDRAWRAEGLMWLGILRWSEASGAQRAAIEKYLSKAMESADPVLAKRAEAALKYSQMDTRVFK